MVNAGRWTVAGIFVLAGFAHFPQFGPLRDAMAQRGIPFAAAVLSAGSVFQIVAGAMFGFDVERRWAAIGLVAFTIASSLMMLDFWNLQGMEKERALGAFMNNIALCGALLAIGFAVR